MSSSRIPAGASGTCRPQTATPASPPRWYVDVWGDHNREAALVPLLGRLDFEARTLRLHPALAKVLSTYGVSHVLSPFPQQEATFALAGHDRHAYVYSVDGAARVRVRARGASRDDGSGGRARACSTPVSIPIARSCCTTRPIRSIRLSTRRAGIAARRRSPSRAAVTHEDSRQIVIDAEAPADGFLLLADTFYPGWTATRGRHAGAHLSRQHLGARHRASEGAARGAPQLCVGWLCARIADHARRDFGAAPLGMRSGLRHSAAFGQRQRRGEVDRHRAPQYHTEAWSSDTHAGGGRLFKTRRLRDNLHAP